MTDNDKDGLYKTLLESTKAIPWKLNWITKEFEYIGPQIEGLLGWTPESWATAQDWIDRIHPTKERRRRTSASRSRSLAWITRRTIVR